MNREYRERVEALRGVPLYHTYWMHYRGGYHATCKGCELPMPLQAMLYADMSICYDCAYGLDVDNNVLFDDEED